MYIILCFRVHIRRTDKVGTEAAFHSVDEYMSAVEEYFKQLALTETITVKRIYLASDDPKVFSDIRNKLVICNIQIT